MSLARGAFLLFACATAVTAPWMLGSMSVAAQKILLAGAGLTFITGLAARFSSRQTPGAKAAWSALRWPLVLGLAFLGLMLAQAMNPSHRVVIVGNLWELVPTGNENFGPTSIAAPFDFLSGDWLPYKNAWRYLLIFSAGWLYCAGLSLGLVEREDARRWMRALGLNAALLAGVCIAHRLTGAHETLWRYAETFDFTGSPVFFYKNHNGAYLAGALALVLGLAIDERNLLWRRGWQATALALWIATISVNSRVASACATVWGILYLAHLWHERRAAGAARLRVKHLAFAAAGVVALGFAFNAIGGGKAVQRFAPALSSPLDFLQGGRFRVLIREVGTEIWSERPVWGWGGGSYMYLFNSHHQRVPDVARWTYGEQPTLNRFVSPTVNCDWIEFGVEYGAVGLALLVLAAAWPLLACLRWGVRAQPAAAFLIVGVVGISVHAWFDYILRNPAILMLFLGMLITATRLAAPRESRRAR